MKGENEVKKIICIYLKGQNREKEELKDGKEGKKSLTCFRE